MCLIYCEQSANNTKVCNINANGNGVNAAICDGALTSDKSPASHADDINRKMEAMKRNIRNQINVRR